MDIQFDLPHLLATIRSSLPPPLKLAIAGTVQFAASVQAAKAALSFEYPGLAVPQAKPLSPGEVRRASALQGEHRLFDSSYT